MSKIILRPYSPDDRTWCVAAHARLYAQQDGFDDSFGPLVEQLLVGFEGQDTPRAAGWVATAADVQVGSIFCVPAELADPAYTGHNLAKLRMFLVEPSQRGTGLGGRMLFECMSFARDAGFAGMTLWTHASHVAACKLYQKSGFHIVSEKPVHSFGQDLIEQEWQIAF